MPKTRDYAILVGMTYPNPHGPSCPWYPHAESLGAPNIKWCEETLCQWVSEPANAWSNLAYLLAGIFILWRGRKDQHSFQHKQFGPIVFFLGLCSFVYHVSNIYLTQVMDFVGIFLVVGWISGMNLIRARRLPPGGLIPYNLAYLGLNTLIVHAMYLAGYRYQILILVGIVIIITTEVMAQKRERKDLRWFVTSLSLFALAVGFSILDHTRVWCDPSQHGVFSQGHALWHWIAGLAMPAIYMHYSNVSWPKRP